MSSITMMMGWVEFVSGLKSIFSRVNLEVFGWRGAPWRGLLIS